METLHLKLAVEKGRKEREIHEFKPGSKIRIGRDAVINTLKIKDAGISSQHLFIELSDKNSTWVVSDLASFNGTFLNGVQLDPHKTHVLKNGHVIKIGQETTLRVNVGVQLRRNPMRAARATVVENVCAVVRRRPGKGKSVSVGVADVEFDEVEERINLEKDICATPWTSEKSNLEKMSLGEWFDYVEVYLTRQIHEETDEIIKCMEARAEQYKEFMAQQNKSPLA